MLNLNCAICAELFTPSDDVHVTICGHMFHIICLGKWLERSRTCPQCRNKCSERNITRVYFNCANLDSSRIDVGSLQEQLDNVQLQLKFKEKDLQNAADEIKKCKEAEKKYMKTVAALEKDIKSKGFLILNYSEKTKFLETQVKVMNSLQQECKKLKEQVEAMDGVNVLLTSTMADAEKILNTEQNPKILSSWVATLKRELKTCEHKKADMRSILKAVQNNLRKEIEQRMAQDEKISRLESENYQLLEKIKCLEDNLKKLKSDGFQNFTKESAGSNAANENSIELCNPCTTSLINEERRSTISPTIKDKIRKIEASTSPYLNIKSCSVLLPPLLMKNQETRTNNNTKSLSNKLTVLKVSPTKTGAGAIRKARSDLNQTYSILKKPRVDLVANSCSSGSAMKSLAPNMVYNGFGGSERADPFERAMSSDEECNAKKQPDLKQKCSSSSSINSRLKTGGLRNFKLAK